VLSPLELGGRQVGVGVDVGFGVDVSVGVDVAVGVGVGVDVGVGVGDTAETTFTHVSLTFKMIPRSGGHS